jgi:hypothetical protein
MSCTFFKSANFKRRFFLFATFIFFPILLFSQSRLIKSFKTESEIVSASVDRAGDFYLVLKSGAIEKYDKDGTSIASFKEATAPSSFDPTNAIRLLTYYKDQQKYTWLSPTLENPGFQSLDASWAIEPIMICPSGDLNLWVLDAADWSLKKISPSQSQVLYEFAIQKEEIPKVKWMREYQNFLFLLDEEKGILIYNSIGKLIRKIEGKSIAWFNFLGEELYYPLGKNLEFFDLYSVEKRSIPLANSSIFVLLTDERMLKVSEKHVVEILEYKPD